jgi:hypothetical protein
MYMYQIAQELDISDATVARDLKEIQKLWLASSLRDFDAARAQEIAKIDQAEREYWAAWQRSQVPAPDEPQFYRTDAQGNETGQPRPWVKPGDPRFLQGVERCVERRCKLLGLDAPQKLDVSGSGGVTVIAGVDGEAALGRKLVENHREAIAASLEGGEGQDNRDAPGTDDTDDTHDTQAGNRGGG